MHFDDHEIRGSVSDSAYALVGRASVFTNTTYGMIRESQPAIEIVVRLAGAFNGSLVLSRTAAIELELSLSHALEKFSEPQPVPTSQEPKEGGDAVS